MLDLIEHNALSATMFEEDTKAELWDRIHFTAYVASQGAMTRQALRLAQRHNAKWLEGLIELLGGQLSTFLISPKMIREKILHISRALADANPHYHMIYRQPNQVYREARFLFVRVSGHMLITIDFPLSRYEPFTAYRIILVPMPVPHQENAAMYLKTSEVGIAINYDKGIYYYLSELEITEIQIKAAHTTKRRIFRFIDRSEYILDIFYDDVENV